MGSELLNAEVTEGMACVHAGPRSPEWIFQLRMGVLGGTWDQKGVFYRRKAVKLISPVWA